MAALSLYNSMFLTELYFYSWILYGDMPNFLETSKAHDTFLIINSTLKSLLHNLQCFAAMRLKVFLSFPLYYWAEEFELCRSSVVIYQVIL
jgi:hypothetical protein